MTAYRAPENQNDSSIHLPFELFIKPVKDEAASIEAGRPIFKEEEYVRIIKSGGRDDVTHKVRHLENDPKEWPKFESHIKKWRENRNYTPEGTPLREWPSISLSQVEELAFFNIKTVEQLSSLSDANLGKVGMGAYQLREKAIAYLKSAKDNSVLEKYAAENADMKKRLEDLERLLSEKTEPKNNEQGAQEEPKKKKLGIF